MAEDGEIHVEHSVPTTTTSSPTTAAVRNRITKYVIIVAVVLVVIAWSSFGGGGGSIRNSGGSSRKKSASNSDLLEMWKKAEESTVEGTVGSSQRDDQNSNSSEKKKENNISVTSEDGNDLEFNKKKTIIPADDKRKKERKRDDTGKHNSSSSSSSGKEVLYYVPEECFPFSQIRTLDDFNMPIDVLSPEACRKKNITDRFYFCPLIPPSPSEPTCVLWKGGEFGSMSLGRKRGGVGGLNTGKDEEHNDDEDAETTMIYNELGLEDSEGVSELGFVQAGFGVKNKKGGGSSAVTPAGMLSVLLEVRARVNMAKQQLMSSNKDNKKKTSISSLAPLRILFAGDSVMRQVFVRLIHILRRVKKKRNGGGGGVKPVLEHYFHADATYTIYANKKTAATTATSVNSEKVRKEKTPITVRLSNLYNKHGKTGVGGVNNTDDNKVGDHNDEEDEVRLRDRMHIYPECVKDHTCREYAKNRTIAAYFDAMRRNRTLSPDTAGNDKGEEEAEDDGPWFPLIHLDFLWSPFALESQLRTPFGTENKPPSSSSASPPHSLPLCQYDMHFMQFAYWWKHVYIGGGGHGQKRKKVLDWDLLEKDFLEPFFSNHMCASSYFPFHDEGGGEEEDAMKPKKKKHMITMPGIASRFMYIGVPEIKTLHVIEVKIPQRKEMLKRFFQRMMGPAMKHGGTPSPRPNTSSTLSLEDEKNPPPSTGLVWFDDDERSLIASMNNDTSRSDSISQKKVRRRNVHIAEWSPYLDFNAVFKYLESDIQPNEPHDTDIIRAAYRPFPPNKPPKEPDEPQTFEEMVKEAKRRRNRCDNLHSMCTVLPFAPKNVTSLKHPRLLAAGACSLNRCRDEPNLLLWSMLADVLRREG